MLHERGFQRGGETHSADYAVVSVQDAPEDQPLMSRDNGDEKLTKKAASKAPAGPAKILFLDGVRGLAALLVVTQHSHEYMQDVNLGACAVDAFFVLSSFLLTMLFMKKSLKLLAQGASYRKWAFTLADYFSKRFFRVYPLFALVATVLWLLPYEDQKRYFLVPEEGHYELLKVLTFSFEYRYFVLWTLPLEISYYFFIPVFVLVVLRLKRFWWIPFIPMYAWVIHEGWYTFRTSHAPLAPHIPTFLTGSMAAVVFVKVDDWVKSTGFEFSDWYRVRVRAVEYTAVALLLSVCFRALLFHWVHKNIAPNTPGFPYISLLVTTIFVIEMLLPSCISTVFEWNVLRYFGKVGFSVYLLHSFVVWSPTVLGQSNYYDRLFLRFGLLLVLATASFHVVEYPSQLMAQRISRFLVEQEKKGACGTAKYAQVQTEGSGDDMGAVKTRSCLVGRAGRWC